MLLYCCYDWCYCRLGWVWGDGWFCEFVFVLVVFCFVWFVVWRLWLFDWLERCCYCYVGLILFDWSWCCCGVWVVWVFYGYGCWMLVKFRVGCFVVSVDWWGFVEWDWGFGFELFFDIGGIGYCDGSGRFFVVWVCL